jgi:hypothetical protein
VSGGGVCDGASPEQAAAVENSAASNTDDKRSFDFI